MRTDNQHERRSNSEVQTAEHPKIPSVEQSDLESESDTDMDLDPEENDETIHQLLTDFTEMVVERYNQDDWFSVPNNTDKLLLDEKGFPDYASLRKNCIELSHDAPWSGHFGRDKTAELVKQIYWRPKMDKDIAEYVRTCNTCQRTKVPNRKPYGLMVPLSIPKRR